jgi:hypothetical protein
MKFDELGITADIYNRQDDFLRFHRMDLLRLLLLIGLAIGPSTRSKLTVAGVA